jgi:predicted oxidoreductase
MSFQLSDIIAGTMLWGSWGQNFSLSNYSKIINSCIENNITTFDCADIYGDYTTEKELGKAISEMKIPRENYQIITKCGIKLQGTSRNYALKHYDYSKEYILWSVENSLKNLKTEFIDVFLLHRPSPLLEAEVVAEAISELKISGKINHFGVSNFNATQIDVLKKHTAINYNQIPFSVTHLENLENNLLDYLKNNQIKTMAWNPLGNYFKPENNNTALKNIVLQLGNKYQVTEDIILLAWVKKLPHKISLVFGTTKPERIANIGKNNSIVLENEDWFAMYAASLGKDVA